MFTGIIQAVGRVGAIEPKGGDQRIVIETGHLSKQDLAPGDSIAVNGVCLTAVDLGTARFAADVSRETLSRTTLGGLHAGDRVNLELALTPTSRLGGHIVSGHVDGVGRVSERRDDARSVRFRISNPPELANYIAEKGSICVDGVSLTVNAVGADWFDVNIVPHTLAATTCSEYAAGTRVNLEVDVLARYLERLLCGATVPGQGRGLTRERLGRAGFIKDADEHDR